MEASVFTKRANTSRLTATTSKRLWTRSSAPGLLLLLRPRNLNFTPGPYCTTQIGRGNGWPVESPPKGLIVPRVCVDDTCILYLVCRETAGASSCDAVVVRLCCVVFVERSSQPSDTAVLSTQELLAKWTHIPVTISPLRRSSVSYTSQHKSSTTFLTSERLRP